MALVGHFKDASVVARRLEGRQIALKIASAKYFSSFKAAFKFFEDLEPECIYVDADVGVMKFFQLLHLKIKISSFDLHVYEEGIGTYRDDLYAGVKKRILSQLGVGTHFGGCMLTHRVHVQKPQLYMERFPRRKVQVSAILKGPAEILLQDIRGFSCLFGYEPPDHINGGVCNVYLSSWSVDSSFMERFSSLPGDCYFKPHPHLRDDHAEGGLIGVPASVPSELLLLTLSTMYDVVRVYHHGSSTTLYCNEQNVDFVHI